MTLAQAPQTFLWLLPLLAQLLTGVRWWRVLPKTGKVVNVIGSFTSGVCLYFILTVRDSYGLEGLILMFVLALFYLFSVTAAIGNLIVKLMLRFKKKPTFVSYSFSILLILFFLVNFVFTQVSYLILSQMSIQAPASWQ